MANSPDGGRSRTRIIILSRRGVACLILLVAVVFLITSNQFWRWMYPIEYQPLIQSASQQYHVDPLLVASVIRTESQFQTQDVSHAGAIGLMQLMPDTAQWIASQMNLKQQRGLVQDDGTIDLSEPEVNVRLGSWYIHYLSHQFNGNDVAAIAAYNAGPKRVSQWLKNGTWNGRLKNIDDIPVGETRHFVDRVFYNYTLYERIYRGDKNLEPR